MKNKCAHMHLEHIYLYLYIYIYTYTYIYDYIVFLVRFSFEKSPLLCALRQWRVLIIVLTMLAI